MEAPELFATGIRNTEKLVVRPGSDEIWGVDHDIDTLATKMESKNQSGGSPSPITTLLRAQPLCEGWLLWAPIHFG